MKLEPFKNLLNEKAAEKIAIALQRADNKFDKKVFLKNIKQELDPLELKERSYLLAEKIKQQLPSAPNKSFPILIRALKKNEADEVGLSGFLVWPLADIVQKYGLNDFDVSMQALYQITQVFTAEFAIRPFLISNPEKTIKQLSVWTKDKSEHVRRLVSEGSRPLLPWGQKIPQFVVDPEVTWHLLELLKFDSSKYVQKSIANHLNDHSKNHAEWLLNKLSGWSKAPELDWIIRHATRTLVKKGHPKALALHGIKPVKIKLLNHQIKNKTIHLGSTLNTILEIQNLENKTIQLMIDHEIAFLKANGKHTIKVFKGKKIQISPKQKIKLELKIPMKPVTTRKYYQGRQKWSPMINGKRFEQLNFKLTI